MNENGTILEVMLARLKVVFLSKVMILLLPSGFKTKINEIYFNQKTIMEVFFSNECSNDN